MGIVWSHPAHFRKRPMCSSPAWWTLPHLGQQRSITAFPQEVVPSATLPNAGNVSTKYLSRKSRIKHGDRVATGRPLDFHAWQSKGMPAAASSAGESGRPWSSESVRAPEGTQALEAGSQASRPDLPGTTRTRSMVPSESVKEGGTNKLGSIDLTSQKIIEQPEGKRRNRWCLKSALMLKCRCYRRPCPGRRGFLFAAQCTLQSK